MIATFGVAQNQLSGDLLWSKQLAPTLMGATRLGQEARLWSRWRPRSLALRYVCGGPTTGGGSIVIAWVPDTDYQIGNRSGEFAVNAALAAQCHQVVRLDSVGRLTLPSDPMAKWYSTDAHASPLGGHGTLFAVLVSGPAGVRGRVTVVVELDWSVEWEGREMADVSSTSHMIVPDEGWYPVFTTSDSSFDATVLTFKAHAGGNMVPWNSAAPGVIYTPDKGVTIYYVDAQKTTRTCNFFTMVLSYETRGLVLHSNAQDAADYQHTGDKGKCIKYTDAAQYSVPSRPTLVPYVSSVSDIRIRALEDKLDKALRLVDELSSRNATPALGHSASCESLSGNE